MELKIASAADPMAVVGESHRRDLQGSDGRSAAVEVDAIDGDGNGRADCFNI